MKRVAIMKVEFDAAISPNEVPAFRGAVIEKVGIEQEVFHNHDNEGTGNGYHYRYPLIQYKALGGRPVVLFIDTAVSEAYHLFRQPSWELNFTRRQTLAKLVSSETREYEVGVIGQHQAYTLKRWQALNQDNYRRFQQLHGIAEQAKYLEGILAGHILGFASGLGIRFEKRFGLAITAIEQQRFRSFEGVKNLAFDIRFDANVELPPYIGLGKGVSQGFGVLYR